ncbi:hypothetical protein [Paraburkholderia aspalathi]|uniref:hypothetical protein n=1 Tax=Paraburkholderia aspalathi TaxID=1324617 RepID=UPI001B167A2A|nr:hypothetical protein [Paraburkholderia aspalathi]CAE6754646.1 hypothetical protein R20943_03080 [Paraburkholderia aspalathi]
MSVFSQADLDTALSEYRAVVAEVMKVTTAWHGDLEEGRLPSAGEITEFQSCVGALNEKARQAWNHYCQVGTFLYRL